MLKLVLLMEIAHISYKIFQFLQNHCLTIEFVEKLTPDDLIKTLKTRQYQHPHHTRDLSKYSKDQDLLCKRGLKQNNQKILNLPNIC